MVDGGGNWLYLCIWENKKRRPFRRILLLSKKTIGNIFGLVAAISYFLFIVIEGKFIQFFEV